MSLTITRSTSKATSTQIGKGGLQRGLDETGQLPPVAIIIKPLDPSLPTLKLDRFTSYSFTSSILIPVDSWNFDFKFPDGDPLNKFINEGDVATLRANDIEISTGIVDITEVETMLTGERAMIAGRDLMGQLEDQSAVSLKNEQLYAKEVTVEAGVRMLLKNTKITNVELRDAPNGKYLLATEPGESKLAGLQRFLEGLNCLAWTGSSGQLIIGRPNMSQTPKGTLIMSRDRRYSNILTAKVTRASTQIGNVYLPIWTGQESVVSRISPEQSFYNRAKGPERLRKLGYVVPKTVVVSIPNADSPQGLSDLNALRVAAGNLLQYYAKREEARENIGERIFACVAKGHYNELGEPFLPDTTYIIEYDRGDINSEEMYLFQVQYILDDDGQKTVMMFCPLNCIVSDIKAK